MPIFFPIESTDIEIPFFLQNKQPFFTKCPEMDINCLCSSWSLKLNTSLYFDIPMTFQALRIWASGSPLVWGHKNRGTELCSLSFFLLSSASCEPLFPEPGCYLGVGILPTGRRSSCLYAASSVFVNRNTEGRLFPSAGDVSPCKNILESILKAINNITGQHLIWPYHELRWRSVATKNHKNVGRDSCGHLVQPPAQRS